MKPWIVAGAVAAACMSSATAGAAEQQHNWQGFYVGASIGADWAHAGWTGTSDLDTAGSSYPIDHSFNAASVNFGGFVGYNFQVSNLVYGIEADYGFSHSSKSVTLDGNEGYTKLTSHFDGLGSVRGRFGIAFADNLIYASAGVGFANAKQDWSTINVFYTTSDSASLTPRVGVAFGGGIEHAFTQAVSVRLDVLHYDFGSISGSSYVSGPVLNNTYKVNLSETVARVGVSFKF